jgi:hypothetical protein
MPCGDRWSSKVPLDGVIGDLGELLHVAHFLWRRPDGILVEVHRERNSRIVEGPRMSVST